MTRFFLILTLITLLAGPGCVRRGGIEMMPETPPSCTQEPVATPEALRDDILRQGRAAYKEHTRRHRRLGHSIIQSNQIVPDKGILSARLLLRMKQGGLFIKGGSEDLLQASFNYPSEQNVPDILSVTSGTARHVEVVGNGRNEEWSFEISRKVPVMVLIEAEEGYRSLNFDDVPLSELAVQAHGGMTDLSVLGEHNFLTSASVSQTDGPIAMNFSGDYDSLSCVNADTAHGDISGIFRGYYRRLSQLHISSHCGDIELDLTGAWRRTARIEITCTGGDCVLFIPSGLGTTIYFRTECGRLISPCLEKKWSSNSYVNNAFEKTKQFLDITVMTTSGNVYVHEVCGTGRK